MAQSYRRITAKLARQIKLVMTDVDGTITSGDGSFSSVVMDAVHCLEEQDVMVGLISGRNLPKLESFARELGISGPIIGENGAVARVKLEGEVIDLGYSQRPALEALGKLKGLFPDTIEERDWNKSRMIDLVIRPHGVEAEDPFGSNACGLWLAILRRDVPRWWPLAARRLYACGGPWYELSSLNPESGHNMQLRRQLSAWYKPAKPKGQLPKPQPERWTDQ